MSGNIPDFMKKLNKKKRKWIVREMDKRDMGLGQ